MTGRYICNGLIAGLFILNFAYAQQTPDGTFAVRSGNQSITLSHNGEIVQIKYANGIEKNVSLFLDIEGARVDNTVTTVKRSNGGIEFRKRFVHDSLKGECMVLERFTPAEGSIRWEVEILGAGSSWSSAIKTRLRYPVQKSSSFWTSWGEPDRKTWDTYTESVSGLSAGAVGKKMRNQWIDPLTSIPFSDALYYYGAPYLEYQNPQIAFCPVDGNLFSIPIFTILDNQKEGLTLALSPEDNTIDLTLSTSKDGDVVFSRLFSRISSGRVTRFSTDIITHPDSWRSGLGWMVKRYPQFFNPYSNDAMKFGGTGSYSNFYARFDAEKMRKMAYTVNWQASFDFPYMGMFLPPVAREKKWKRFGRDSISINEMASHAQQLKDDGFYTFSYFNVTEFGANVKYPYTSTKSVDDPNLWMDCNDYLDKKLLSAILKVPAQMNLKGIIYPQTKNNGAFYTWEDGIVMDCGDSSYSSFLLDQARRHISEIPASFGICIDRLDWLRMFNLQADDSISWFNGPVRSLISSYKGFMGKLGPLMHNSGKAILVNNHNKRIDLLEQVDGIFDEFTYNGIALNTTALLCVNKPALGWTDGAKRIINEGGDYFFQKYLYMGVFPMCPFPGNDHSIHPDTMVDKLYLDYGKLMHLIKERKWILTPHVIEAVDNNARVNIFEIPGGYSIPVVYADKGVSSIQIKINSAVIVKRAKTFSVYHPGKDVPVTTRIKKAGKNELILEVPVYRGCAMVFVQAAGK